jgi:hypothetical protein
LAQLATAQVVVHHSSGDGWIWELREGDEVLDSSVLRGELHLSVPAVREAAQRACGTLLPTEDPYRFDLLEVFR